MELKLVKTFYLKLILEIYMRLRLTEEQCTQKHCNKENKNLNIQVNISTSNFCITFWKKSDDEIKNAE